MELLLELFQFVLCAGQFEMQIDQLSHLVSVMENCCQMVNVHVGPKIVLVLVQVLDRGLGTRGQIHGYRQDRIDRLLLPGCGNVLDFLKSRDSFANCIHVLFC